MRVAVLFAGGKDSTYSAYKALKDGLEVKYLITMVPSNPHSWMFHTVNIDITRYQAEAMGIKQLMPPTSGERDMELEDLKRAIAAIKNEVDGIVTGAIASSYQKNRVDQICRGIGLVSIAPLWGRDPTELLREMISTGFEAIITSVAAQGFHEGWLGRKIDETCLEDLEGLSKRFGINMAGEGGEYESLVLDAPLFKSKIEVVEAEKVWRGTSGCYLIKKARLTRK